MKKLYRDNAQGKEQFTTEVIDKVVKQLGWDKAEYHDYGTYEVINVIMEYKNGFKAVQQIDVTADSCIAMLTDVLLNIQ